MKIAILLGRGVEGCGVTRCAIEFQKAMPGTQIIATLDKKWGRKKGMEFDYSEFLAASPEETQNVLNNLNTMDLVVIYSVPSKDHPIECQDSFLKLVKDIKVRKVMIHVDHSVKSLHNNANLKELCSSVDLVMTHSSSGVLAKWFDKERIQTPFDTMELGFDYDYIRARYWKPIEETEGKTVRWIGRSARWKGPHIMVDFHDAELRSRGYRTILEGLEASINYVLVLYKDMHEKQIPRDVVNKFRIRKELGETKEFTHGEEVYGGPAYCYPPYINTECMERLSTSGFGSDLYHLKSEQYGNNIENCHAECVAVGTVPIFHRHFGQNIIHKVTGDACINSKDSGTIWLDESNYEACRDIMTCLSADKVLRDEWREMAFEFWKSHSDSDDVVKDIVRKAMLPRKVVSLQHFFGE